VSWLTAYDYPTALLMDRAGIEMILVGDSVAMTLLGYESTLPVTMEEMLTFVAAVCRATERAFVVADMPFLSYQVSSEEAIRNAGRFLAQGGADAVKLEGGARVAPTIAAIVAAGIPVVGHIGLTPQSAGQLGGYRAQGRSAEAALALVEDAAALEEAGAFAVLVECVPAEVTELIRERLRIPVYGLGSGAACDGQLMIVHDLLGLFDRFTPKFVKRYANLAEILVQAFTEFRTDVKTGAYPGPEHGYAMREGEPARLRKLVRRSA
jgi:3-methyl-2-oxobutanoate hydroxymethyltransferase